MYIASFFALTPPPLSFRVKNVPGRAQDKELAFCCAASMGNVRLSIMSLVGSSGVFYFILWTLKWLVEVEGQSQLLSFICISFNGGTQVFKAIDEEDCSETMRDGVTLLPK